MFKEKKNTNCKNNEHCFFMSVIIIYFFKSKESLRKKSSKYFHVMWIVELHKKNVKRVAYFAKYSVPILQK